MNFHKSALAANTDSIVAIQGDVTQLQMDFGTLQTTVWSQADQIKVNRDGVALSLAMAGIGGLQAGENFALAANWGFYDTAHAFAFSGAARVNETFSLNGGIGFGAETGEVGARAGVRWGW